MGTGQGVSQPGAQRCPLLGTQAPAQPVWAPVPALPLTVTPTFVPPFPHLEMGPNDTLQRGLLGA